ncbi:PfkB family carbohydrate kinase [Paenibacillus alginolyticus]|uniref:PfkB family carbohydrate kinase n=1 Tax=Paenibacillus alginolyticus TaxID=59839 RepID=A0ABT4GGX4_9BACL|nr:PfkB family carbohydrate kinase [Paenibacillus alginolyticus]MCY9695423.1 PfkB family carbohydrate kinase [Paenibacillus alginolyticus]MEC0146292.1 PfkB family carbohydrate kinase [Paenibacillus alginolyticus]
MKLIGIGDNVVDYYKDQGLMYPGGNALNVAVASKRNGASACAYLGIVGDDAAAEHVVNSMGEEGIDFSQIRRAYGPNGEAVVALNEQGDRIFVGTNRGIRVQSKLTLLLTQDDLDYINQYDVVHTSVNSDMEHELHRLTSKPLSFDFSTRNRWNQAYLNRICPYLTYAFFSGSDMSSEEINSLFKEVHRLGVQVIGVTRGAEPAVFSDKGIIYTQSHMTVNVVDTMGAGDSFIGGFLPSYHEYRDMKKALVQASRSAAATCTHYGGFGYGKKKQ